MEVFVSRITKRFSIRGIAKILGMNNSLAHRTIRPLIKNKLFMIDEEKFLSLNYKRNHDVLAYAEYLRRNELMDTPKNKVLAMFAEDAIEKFPKEYFVLLIFGSAVISTKPADIDILIIIEKTEEIESAERSLYNIARRYTLPLHTIVISFESAYEMLATRDQKNVMNEVLNKHLILYGAELFYKLIKKGRR